MGATHAGKPASNTGQRGGGIVPGNRDNGPRRDRQPLAYVRLRAAILAVVRRSQSWRPTLSHPLLITAAPLRFAIIVASPAATYPDWEHIHGQGRDVRRLRLKTEVAVQAAEIAARKDCENQQAVKTVCDIVDENLDLDPDGAEALKLAKLLEANPGLVEQAERVKELQEWLRRERGARIEVHPGRLPEPADRLQSAGGDPASP